MAGARGAGRLGPGRHRCSDGRTARRLADRRAARIGGALLATNYAFVMWNRAALMESTMTAFIVVAWAAYALARARRARGAGRGGGGAGVVHESRRPRSSWPRLCSMRG